MYNVFLPFVSLYVITQIATQKRTTQAHLLKISKDSRLYVASLLYILFIYYTKTTFFTKKYLLYANKFTVQQTVFQSSTVTTVQNMKLPLGLPWYLSSKESTCRCKRHGFNPWPGKIPRAAVQRSPYATTIKPVIQSL